MKGSEFDVLPGFPKAFIDFINKEPYMLEQFPGNALVCQAGGLSGRADAFKNRAALSGLVRKSMSILELTPAQERNIEKLKGAGSLTVHTRLVPIFLGGPSNNLIKAFSAVSAAKRLEKAAPDLDIVPLIFVDDDAPSNLDASEAAVFDKEFDVRVFSCAPGGVKSGGRIIGKKIFDYGIEGVLDRLEKTLPEGEAKMDAFTDLRNIYTPEKGWADAFIELFSLWLGASGALFLKASAVRGSGAYGKTSAAELKNPGRSLAIVEEANRRMESAGREMKIRAFEINLFFINEDRRHNIETHGEKGKYKIAGRQYTIVELRDLADLRPEAFAPRVMLKNIFTDAIQPGAAFIAGPSEIAHGARLSGLYDYFGLAPPAFFARHSATFLDGAAFANMVEGYKDDRAFNYVFPRGGLQERVISPVYFIAAVGSGAFLSALEDISAQVPDRHYSAVLS